MTEGREFFEYLTKEVSSAMAKGIPLEEMRKAVTLARYKNWVGYEHVF